MKELPDEAVKQSRSEFDQSDFKAAAFLTTVVRAREERSAEIRARDASDEARSLRWCVPWSFIARASHGGVQSHHQQQIRKLRL